VRNTWLNAGVEYLTERSVTPSPKAWIMAFQSVAPGWTLPWLTATRSKVRSDSGVHAKGILLAFGIESYAGEMGPEVCGRNFGFK
jgi:hypothetical protein